MPISFPTNPDDNDTHVIGSITYQYNATDDKWTGLGITPSDRLVEGSNSLEIDASNNLVWTGNDVGIGTQNPTKKLHVQGTVGISGRTYLGAPNQSTDNLRDSQTTVNRHPELQINSEAGPGSSIGLISWHTSTAGYYSPQFWLAKSNGAVGTNALVTSGTDLGAINFAGNDGAAFLNAASIRGEVDGTAAADDMPGRLVFYTNGGNINPTERLRIDSGGNITLGYAGSSLYFQNGFNNSTARIQNGGGSNNSELKFLVKNAGVESEKMRLTSTAGLAVVTAGSMSANAGNETLYIQGEGHSGHGTGNTRSVVSIIGALTSNPSGIGIWMGARTNENTAVIGTRTANGNLAFETYSGGWAERMRLLNTGQLIVGGSTLLSHPNMDDLQVGNASGNKGLTICSGTTGYGSVCFGDSSDGSGNDRYRGFVEYYHGDDSIRLGTESVERLRITSGGMLTHSGGHTNNSGGTNMGAGVYNRINAYDTVPASSNRTYTFTGLASGWMTIKGGGYSNAGQSQFAVAYQLGGYMTSANKFDVVTLQSWGSGATISVSKNAQSYDVIVTNNSGTYELQTWWCVEGNNSGIKVVANA